MDKIFGLKHWAFVLILLFAAKLVWLTMTTWLDVTCLGISFIAYMWAFNKEEAKKQAPQMHALKEIEKLIMNFTSLEHTLYKQSVEIKELAKVTEEAKKLMSQTNIQAAFVPRRKMGAE